MIVITCPLCQSVDVIRFGTNRSGTSRYRCKACTKTWTPHPINRAMTPEKEQAILGSLAERISQRGIAYATCSGRRALKVSRLTIRELRKKTHSA